MLPNRWHLGGSRMNESSASTAPRRGRRRRRRRRRVSPPARLPMGKFVKVGL